MTDTHDFSLEEAWQTAIQREKEAYEFYMRVYRSATDPQETTHQRLLEDEFDRMFRPDM